MVLPRGLFVGITLSLYGNNMSALKNIQEQKEFYNEYWRDMKPISSYKAQRAVWIIEQLVQIRKKIQTGTPALLDLGCGDGRLVPQWQSVAGGLAFGLELSPEAVAKAQEMYPSVVYTEGDATKTPYDDAQFDIIVCQEVLEHVEEQEQLIKECNRILKEGGYLILTTPNKFYFDRRNGGNYSKQPIENIIDKKELYTLLKPYFNIETYITLIYAKGNRGVYNAATNRLLLALLRRIGFDGNWKKYLLKKGYGLHMAVVCSK